VTEREEIVVPATIGNLGSGFDALSAALQLYLRLRILDVDPAAPDRLVTEFAGAPPPGANGIEHAYTLARARAGVTAPGVRILVSTEIPIRAGLGSSAAAAVAGLRLYQSLTGALSEEDMLSLGCECEGHPDNVAACLLGGLTISCLHEDGRVTARSSPWPDRLRFVIATPDTSLATKDARAVLPQDVPLDDAVFNLQRALLLVRALDDERYDDLREAFRDRWHQLARSALVPGLREALAIDHPAILGVCLSGSGPSVAAVAAPGHEQEAAEVLGDVYRHLQLAHTIRIVAAHQPASAAVLPITIH
jgi:homoserine kinase